MIVVAFPFTRPLPEKLAVMMIESVRRHVSGPLHVVQMSDDATAPVMGTDSVRRLEKRDFIEWRLQHMINLTHVQVNGPYSVDAFKILWLDYDVIVQLDLAQIFLRLENKTIPFDVALTRRDAREKTVSDALLADCPHNMGVAWSLGSGRALWIRALQIYRTFKNPDGWMDGQRAIERAIADTPAVKVLSLSCHDYNYTPQNPGEDLSDKWAVHYKGERKRWLVGEDARRAEQMVTDATARVRARP